MQILQLHSSAKGAGMANKILWEQDTRRITEEIWETIDMDQDGEITKEEFIENALKSEFISAMFSNI